MTPMTHLPDGAQTVPDHPRRRLLQGGAAALALPWLHAWGAVSALTPRPLRFPRDHGSHNDTRTEWWRVYGSTSSSTSDRARTKSLRSERISM